MGADLGRADAAGMLDVRRALPATPVAVLPGLVATVTGLGASGAPWMALITGLGALVTVFTLAYALMASWSERARRIVGYLAAAVLASLVGSVLALFALLASLCGGWSSGPCYDDTLLVTLALVALATPILVVGLYAAVDHRTLPPPLPPGQRSGSRAQGLRHVRRRGNL
jgi:hypothetical protein